ncbi:unnamed protein product [Mytilus edulis]|uniref:Uncharacterized protein n=1 Tax=Mytilus edulis TaxID=6550 RepID=A0A8S3SUI0_MYTED|nr:unnamed protein product [Mytilus edulis]
MWQNLHSLPIPYYLYNNAYGNFGDRDIKEIHKFIANVNNRDKNKTITKLNEIMKSKLEQALQGKRVQPKYADKDEKVSIQCFKSITHEISSSRNDDSTEKSPETYNICDTIITLTEDKYEICDICNDIAHPECMTISGNSLTCHSCCNTSMEYKQTNGGLVIKADAATFELLKHATVACFEE